MAKKQESQTGKRILNTLLVSAGIYLVVFGVLSNDSQSWQSFFIALGLGLVVGGTVGFAKMK